MSGLEGARIVFLNNFAGPGLGGGEVNLMHVVTGCVGAGMEVTVICPPGVALATAATAAGASVLTCDLNSGAVRALRGVRRLLRDRPVDIVAGSGYLTNQIARWAAPKDSVAVNGVQVMPHAPGVAGARPTSMLARTFADRLGRGRVGASVAVSNAVARALIADGADPAKVRVVHNGIDVAEMASRAASAQVPDLPAAPLLVGAVSRMEPVKGLDTFVRAAVSLAEARDDVAFVLVGGGSQLGELEQLAAPLVASGRMTFTGVLVDPAGVLSRLDVAVAPSLSEGFGISALEAMALGVPVVASDADGLAEVVERDVTGLLVPAGDAASLANAIATLLDDASGRHAMGAAGRRRAETEFSLAVMRQAYLDVYSELLASR